MPRSVCSSSTTTYCSRPRKLAHRPWNGNRAPCSISGLVSTTLALRRTHVRASGLVSPSYVAATRPSTSRAVSDRSWSWANAFVGNTSSAEPGGEPVTASTIGSW